MSTQSGYERVMVTDLPTAESAAAVESAASPGDASNAAPTATAVKVRSGIRLLVLPLSLLLCLTQSWVTLVAENTRSITPTSTLISVLSFAVLFALVLVLNPLLRLLGRTLPLNRAELSSIFAALAVTAGVSTFGLTAQLVPMIAAPWNPDWNTPQRGWERSLLPYLNRSLYITDPQTIRAFRQGVDVPRPAELAPPVAQVNYYIAVIKSIDWAAWAKPIAGWLVMVFAVYCAFYCLTYVVLDQWDSREKLIFPLAKLPEALLPDSDTVLGRVPAIFKTGGFWAGFALSFGVLSLNASQSAGWLSGLGLLQMGMSGLSVQTLVEGSIFEGLCGGPQTLMFLIIFTAVGISFLLPLETSFSIWFYFLVGKAVILTLVWMGYGRNGSDFPTEWLWTNNPVTAQGAGGILLFSAVSLWKSLHDYFTLSKGKSSKERVLIGLPLLGLAVSLGVLTMWLVWNQITLGWAIGVVIFLTLLSLGLMRLVAEGGIYWFQAHSSLFHLYKMTGLSGLLLGPLLPIYSVLFLDIKTFIAPNMLNSAKMRADVRAERLKFHLNIVICLVVTVLFSLGVALILSHARGANEMNRWFYTSGPASALDTAAQAMTRVPTFELSTAIWYAIGASWVGLSIFLRQTLFWFPHPIGYIMLINPLMAQMWFSFFLGWIAKRIVVKYGGKATFDRVRLIFLGLIFGELLGVAIWMMSSLMFGFSTGGSVTLNRYGP
jgi:hypothetical protein